MEQKSTKKRIEQLRQTLRHDRQLEFPFVRAAQIRQVYRDEGPALRMTGIVAAEMDYSALVATATDLTAEISYFEAHPQEGPPPRVLKRAYEIIEAEMEDRIIAHDDFVLSTEEQQ